MVLDSARYRDFVLALIDVTLIGVFGASLDGRRVHGT